MKTIQINLIDDFPSLKTQDFSTLVFDIQKPQGGAEDNVVASL